MHIPTLMLSGTVCAATAIASSTGLAGVSLRCRKEPTMPEPMVFAGVVAFVFAAQLLNFPVQGGTSGHFVGGVLAAALLGTGPGILAMAVVLAVQAILFSDGGLMELGANVLTMGFVGAGFGGWFRGRLMGAGAPGWVASALAAWGSVVAAAFVCALLLVAAGKAAFSAVVPAMVGVHALIGVGEAAITVGVLALVGVRRPVAGLRQIGASLAWGGIFLALLSPLACAWPDGLDSVSRALGMNPAAASAFVAPLADYQLPGFSSPLSTIAAGLIGTVATFGLGWGIFRLAAACVRVR